jgi:N-acetylglucosamine-6-phosphate deacetylase
MPTIIKCQSVITPDGTITPGAILVSNDGRIAEVGREIDAPAAAESHDLRDATLVPGFIDLHVHGGGGFSLATRDWHEIESYARWVVSRGVTGFLATVFAADLDEALEFVRVAGSISDWAPEGGAEIHGINLEGPFINPKRRGALPETWVTAASVRDLAALSEASDYSIALVTVAPEIPGAEDVLQDALKEWTVVAVGHTDATYDEARRAFESGASHLTHAFNGMRPFHHRDPGPVLAALDSPGVTIEVIADGVHLHPATLRALVRAAGPSRIALITDAVPPAGLGSGAFRVGNEEAQLVGGRLLLPDGTIAGSSATMDQALRNLVEWQASDLPDAVRMVSTTPARVLRLDERKGRIASGFDADLVALDSDSAVVMTWVGGRLVFRRD